MCDHCLEILSGNPIKPTFRLRLISLGFKLKIKYRVFRYTTSKKYAEKWEAEHFKPLLDQASYTPLTDSVTKYAKDNNLNISKVEGTPALDLDEILKRSSHEE